MQAELPLLNQFCATTAALSKQKEHFKKRRSELVQNRSGLRSALLQYLKDNNLTCVAVPSADREGQLYCRLKTKSCPRAITLGCVDQAWQKGGCPLPTQRPDVPRGSYGRNLHGHQERVRQDRSVRGCVYPTRATGAHFDRG